MTATRCAPSSKPDGGSSAARSNAPVSSDGSARVCPRLWTSAFVDRDGEVYACCHYQPASMGNISHATLAEIRSGPAATEMRRESLANGTPCLATCTLLSDAERNHPVVLGPAAPGHLERLKVLFGEGCTLACTMCGQNHRDPRTLSAALVLAKAPTDIGTQIEVQGGEPLLLKESRAYLRELIRLGRRPSVITNGLFLKGELAREIVGGCADVKVSINAATEQTHELVNRGSSWRVIIANLQAAVSIRDQASRPAKIIGHMTLVPENVFEAAEFIGLCAQLKLNGAEFGYDRAVPEYLAKNQDRAAALSASLVKAISDYGSIISITELRLRLLGLIDEASRDGHDRVSSAPERGCAADGMS
jgi:sulfatase maturation enzyme AslB (radical SAM superfamily)